MINVLIIEDDPMVAEFNKRYLEQLEGFNLVSVSDNGKEAFKVLEQEQVDLILLDIFMPKLNGLEFLSEVRAKDAAVDIIIISAANDKVNINKAIRLGAVDYLIKPFEFERFESALRRYKSKKVYFDRHKESSQEELDELLFRKGEEDVAEMAELPKGLTRETLRMVWNEIIGLDDDFSTDDLTFNVGVSRVSTRKYLSFLTDIGVLEAQTVYGSVGRPQTRYSRVPESTNIIKSYL
ncbi:response regulator [Pseudalkalibacillus salsuginis]|uniref:response regulator n=1 Tax=Pseudalkalibacillus salsuginis TaxID=2910972 RepID=UPI001F23E449|nr:response regulator [Pseudalkalibacillus salsuginis]MCF6410254.1 response regulator [Pseudalkalibacillus salsuginis]